MAAFTVDLKIGDLPEVRALLKEASKLHTSDQALIEAMKPVVEAAVAWYLATGSASDLECAIYTYIHSQA